MSLATAPVAYQVEGIFFTYYTPDDIRKLSVKKLTQPVTFDTLGVATKGGLYDPAMGPLERGANCATCNLSNHDCPGHFGHIELALPVYHPLLFKSLYQILRAKCSCCHGFRLHSSRVEVLMRKLALLERNQVVAAMVQYEEEERSLDWKALEARFSKGSSDEKKEFEKLLKVIEDIKEEMHGGKNKKKKNKEQKRGVEPSPIKRHLGRHAQKLILETLNLFFRRCSQLQTCENCSAPIIRLRTDKRYKIFRLPLSEKKHQKWMAMKMQWREKQRQNSEEDEVEDEEREEPGSEEEMELQDKRKSKRKAAESEEDEEEEEEEEKGEEEEELTVKKSTRGAQGTYLSPTEAKNELEKLWKREPHMCSYLYSTLDFESKKRIPSCSAYFLEVLPVPPNRFRPPNTVNDSMVEHPHNSHLTKIITLNQKLLTGVDSNTTITQVDLWLELQQAVSNLIDSGNAPPSLNLPPGIKQLLEKKQGLFRKHMMGKRVNFAARSVISPDPYIETNEIGLPWYFAQRLTYPEPVTEFNFAQMRDAVINGPLQHPGATHVEDENGRLIALSRDNKDSRVAISKTLRTFSSGTPHGVKKVLRHIRDGDVVLVNRQPTLHKPSIMAHKVRVLTNEKTIRLHYANCKTFNADFDGDEINVHFPQDEIARAEGYEIALTDYQYIVPTNGEPIRGLIQDHICTGVLLTKRDTFFTRDEFQQLVYSGIYSVNTSEVIDTPIPTILRPQELFSGKQVITAVLNHITKGRHPITLPFSKTKIAADYWGKGSDEGAVVIRDNELLLGVLEKSQYGASTYGLVHAAYEVYGADIAGKLLTCFGRLFTRYLQHRGLTCGIDDMLLLPHTEKTRKKQLELANNRGYDVAVKYVGEDEGGDLKKTPSKLKAKVGELLRKSPDELARLDGMMKREMHEVTSSIIKECLPGGQMKAFPENNMALMTISGAKGGTVNFSQISCLLGQQELEGKRPPMMISGKTLPSFAAFDPSARAGGYIMGRFLTGIKPQEYFFHCMAGREGLIDTAVKTSRSGYLQRCIIKHLEGLRVSYDRTVRDADGTCVQFHYGEDSLDITKTKWLDQFAFLGNNYTALLQKLGADQIEGLDTETANKYLRRLAKDPSLDPVLAEFDPSSHLGSVSEKFQNALQEYLNKNPDSLLLDKSKPTKDDARKIGPTKFKLLMYLKYLNSLADPGEAVGLLAAQSIGEPSTQMTLNTFHLAGRGDVNVTLGIPRLREIIMVASKVPSTPSMVLPMIENPSSKDAADELTKRLCTLPFSEILEDLTVAESLPPLQKGAFERKRAYQITMKFVDKRLLKEHGVKFRHLTKVVETDFLPKLLTLIKKELKDRSADDVGVGVTGSGAKEAAAEDQTGEVEDEPETKSKKKANSDEKDTTTAKEMRKKKEITEYDDVDEDVVDEDEEAKILEMEAEMEGSEDEDDEGGFLADEAGELKKKKKKKGKKTVVRTRSGPTSQYLRDFSGDLHANTYTTILEVPISSKKLLMISLIERVLVKLVVRSVPGIAKSFTIVDSKDSKKVSVMTQGVNFQEVWALSDIIDVNKIQCNDIYAILHTYGVEAARNSIKKEIAGVFEVYGISVDPRHLSLIADYMTFEGDYRAMNRIGMESNPSPFLKMSFETTTHFLRESTLYGDYDDMKSPSSRLVLGRVVEGGTGCIELLQPLA